MIRTGTLASIACRVAVLSALVCWTNNVFAETLSARSLTDTRNQGWVSTGEDKRLREDKDADATWQPQRAAANTEQASVSDDTESAKPTRWLAPTKDSSQAPSGRANARSDAQPVNSAQKSASDNARPNSRNDSTAAAPKPFDEPPDAQRLLRSAAQGREPRLKAQASASHSATRSTAKPSRPSDRPTVRSSAATARVASTATTPDALADETKASDTRSQHARGNPTRNNSRPSFNRPRPEHVSQQYRWDDAGWIRPLKQVAYQFTSGPDEMELPPPEGGPGFSDSMSPEGGYPQDAWSDGEWIGAPYGRECCDGNCGPQCGCPDCGCADGFGPGCGDGVSCGCGGQDDLCCLGVGDDQSCHTIRVRVPRFQEITVFGGVHGFKGPFDRERDSGNFGFQEGFNIGAKIPFSDFGYQIGYQSLQSQLSGDADTGIADAFRQNFFTIGAFHRTPDGFQGGIALDELVDDRYMSIEFSQLRLEMSFVDHGCHEFGLMAAFHLNDYVAFGVDDEEEEVVLQRFRPTDQYLLFYRLHGCTGGEGRAFVGISDDSDAIVGADFLLPLKDSWSLQSEFTYLIPDEDAGSVGARQEAWNIAINLVWHWQGRARECHQSPYRPLFNVADNGSMIIDDRP